MKKLIVTLLIVTLIISTLSGCAAKPQEATAPQGDSSSNSEVKPVEFTVASVTQANTSEGRALDVFKKLVEERSKGQITVKLFNGGTLGGESDNMEQLKIGEIQMAIIGDILTSQYAPDLDPTVVPFIYPDVDSVFKYWEGPFGEKIQEALATKGGVTVAALQSRGARNLTTNKKIEKPEDLKGLKIRVPEIPSWVAVWKGLGALPTPIAWTETYSALQMNVVDAQENPLSNIYTAKIYEVQKYTTKTEHLFNVWHWTVSKKSLETMTPEQQKIIIDATKEAAKWGTADQAKAEVELAKQLKDAKMEIVTVDKQLFRAAALPYLQELSKGWAPGVWDEVKGYLE